MKLLLLGMLMNPLIIAHRGGSLEAPENTMKAFQHAIDIQADFIEVDVRLTKDHVPIILHDSNAKRHWHAGEIHLLTFDEILRVLGKKKSFYGERIPSLKEVLKFTKDRIGLMIEIKGDGVQDFSHYSDQVIKLLKNHMSSKPVLVGSFYPQILREFKKKLPDQKRILIMDQKKYLSYLEEIDPEYVAIDKALYSKRFVKKLHALNKKVWVWTVNQISQMRRYLVGEVEGIITDKPDALMRYTSHTKPKTL